MQLHEPPPFIPEGYTPITEAIAAIDGGWPALRQHLCAGRVRGFIFTDERRLVRVPKADWASPKNDSVDATGVANKITRLRLGDRVRNGFAVVATDDLKSIKQPLQQTPVVAPTRQDRRPGRRARARESAARALADLYPNGIPNRPWKTITAEVNDLLIKNGEHGISIDTVRRAARLISSE